MPAVRTGRGLRVGAGLLLASLVACSRSGPLPLVDGTVPQPVQAVSAGGDEPDAEEPAGGDAGAPARAAVATTLPTHTPTRTPTPTPTPPPAPPVVALAGDVHGEAGVRRALAEGRNPFDSVAPLLAAADVAAVNLETAVAEAGTPADKDFTFLADPAILPALADAGIDVVSVANNHARDYGLDALLETVDLARAAGLLPVGAGRNAQEAYAPAVVEVRGRTIAFVGVSRVLPEVSWKATIHAPGIASAYEEGAAVAAVQAAAAVADHVVVLVHWGSELAPCPDEVQRRLARALVDAGADVVAGHHPHVLQGIAEVGGAVVAFSLGNFAFTNNHAETRRSLVLEVTLGDPASVGLLPVSIGADAVPAPALADEAAMIRRTVAERSPGGLAGCGGI